MGCTSSKKIKKHTSSIEDVSQQKEVPQTHANDSKSPNKNGQVAKQTNAIQIPGANKSFLAPDGIPFIDEEVDEEGDQLTRTSVSEVKVEEVSHAGGDGKTVTTTTTTVTKISALGEEKSTTHHIVTSEPRPDVIGQILAQEDKHHREGEVTNKSFSEVTNNNTSPREDVAATKIQANVRGYLDRKKVKSIRAEHQHQNGFDSHPTNDDSRHVITTEEHFDDTDDPKLNSAATRIQANYKGYKIRKEMSIKKEAA